MKEAEFAEMKVASHPDDLVVALKNLARNLARIGLEAGPLSQWLFSGLAGASLPAICIETRHAKAFLKAQVNKTDRNDARGIAQMMRVNLFRPVHVKTLMSQNRRALLTARKLLQERPSQLRTTFEACCVTSVSRLTLSAPPNLRIASRTFPATFRSCVTSWRRCSPPGRNFASSPRYCMKASALARKQALEAVEG